MDKVRSIAFYALDRLKEPSSYNAIAILLAGIHMQVDPGLWQLITGAGVAVAALIGYFLPESANK